MIPDKVVTVPPLFDLAGCVEQVVVKSAAGKTGELLCKLLFVMMRNELLDKLLLLGIRLPRVSRVEGRIGKSALLCRAKRSILALRLVDELADKKILGGIDLTHLRNQVRIGEIGCADWHIWTNAQSMLPAVAVISWIIIRPHRRGPISAGAMALEQCVRRVRLGSEGSRSWTRTRAVFGCLLSAGDLQIAS